MCEAKDKDLIIEDLLASIEGAENFMRGMTLDPQIPATVKNAIQHKVSQLEAITERYSDL